MDMRTPTTQPNYRTLMRGPVIDALVLPSVTPTTAQSAGASTPNSLADRLKASSPVRLGNPAVAGLVQGPQITTHPQYLPAEFRQGSVAVGALHVFRQSLDDLHLTDPKSGYVSRT